MRLAAISLLLSAGLRAEVSLPALFSDHMVIQRNLPVHVWGKSSPGEHVTVSFRGEERAATADDLGRWSVYMPEGDPGGPFAMTVRGSNVVTLKDVLVGDVWVASGQSNMEMAVSSVDSAEQEIAAARHPKIRLFHVGRNVSNYPLDDVAARGWTECSPETVAEFSGVAYFFGRHLEEKLNVPMGLISTSWGGTPAEAWTSLHALSADASLMPAFASWSDMMDRYGETKARRDQQIADWQKAVDRAKASGTKPPSLPWAPNERFSWSPAGLYNAMIAPLTPFPIRGAIWYQGESNATKTGAPLYAHLFQTMIQDWRRAWGVGDFPFLFVQLANYKTGPDAKWPELREAQRQTLALRNTGMAVTIDIGDAVDIHPKNKQEVGRRLALAARHIAYGETLDYSGPLFRQAVKDGSSIRVWFDHAAGLATRGGGPLRGFEIAGRDGKYVVAEAKIEGGSVVLSSAGVPEPQSVRYAWSDNPDGNLVNATGLPASPFHSGKD